MKRKQAPSLPLFTMAAPAEPKPAPLPWDEPNDDPERDPEPNDLGSISLSEACSNANRNPYPD